MTAARTETEAAVSAVPSARGTGTAERLDRVGNQLTMAGLRLARLRTRLDAAGDRLMLIQARSDLEEALAEVRKLALAAVQQEGS